MKFAFLGYDYSVDVLMRLVKEGHKPLRVFSFPCDKMFYFNDQMKAFCESHNIPIQEKRITQSDIEKLYDENCEVVLACGYPYKIPEIDDSRIYGINLHPALLPRVRGMMPIPFVIMEEPEAAGITLHRLSQEFDCGDIIIQKPLECDAQTDVETLGAKVSLASPDVVAECFNDLETLWKGAKAQDNDKASHYSPPDNKTRSLDWNGTVDDLLSKGRAFGRYGVLAQIKNEAGRSQKLAVYQFSGWKESHEYTCGYIVRSSPRDIILGVKDGFICLKDFQVLQ